MSPALLTLASELSDRLERPLPGHEAHLTMAPQSPARQENLTVNKRDCREAGVLVPLLQHGSKPVLVLTVRREHLPDHAGQISFPGGQRENGERLRTTALRETQEEIALNPSVIQIVGSLTSLYIPPSNFCVYPFVGIVNHSAELRPTDQEVARLLRVPLADFFDPRTLKTETRSLHGEEVDVPYYEVSGYKVWGATAMILAEFLTIVRDVKSLSSE